MPSWTLSSAGYERSYPSEYICSSSLSGTSIIMKQVFRIDLILYVIQHLIVTVCNDHIGTILECLKIVDHKRAEERLPIFQCRLIDNDRCAFCLNPLHDTLHRGLPEVVRIALHGQTVHPDRDWSFFISIPHCRCAIVPVCDKVFSGPIALYYCLNQVFWNILIVCQQLFRILR